MFIAFVLIFRPVPIVFEQDALVEQLIIDSIYTNKGFDVIFTVKDSKKRYYNNRGLENGLKIMELQSTLPGNEVVMKYPKYWTPLDWNNSVRHISKLEFEGRILFNEFKKKN